MKDRWITFIEFLPWILGFGVMFFAFWIYQLIELDTLTQEQAQILGGILVGVIFGCQIASLYLLKYQERQRSKELENKVEIQDQKLKELEEELNKHKQWRSKN